ncbi:hypothetical protein MHYP_G00230580 [Metynnis hypsauchen]
MYTRPLIKSGSDIQGRSIMVDVKGEESQQQQDGGGAAFSSAPGGASKVLVVNNLAFSATEDSLQSVFEKAVGIRIPQNNGRAKGYAFVEFESTEDAKEALDSCNNTEVEGRTIRLEFRQSRGDGGGKGSSGPTKTLFVKGLSEDTTEQTLRDSFEGAVSARIAIDKKTGSSKGYAFVEFESTEDAKEALDSCNNTEVEGRTIRLEFSQSRGDGGGKGSSGPTKTLFVKGLSEDTTEQTLRDSFEGAVAARIATDKKTGSSKGFGFVDFDSEEDCKAAKEAMEDGEVDGSRVTLDYARPKVEGGRPGGCGGFGGRGGRGGGRGGNRRGGRGGFRGGRGGGGFGKPQGIACFSL